MDRTILHCDLNGFYAAVECLHRPELKEVPMAVCGDVEKRHGMYSIRNRFGKATISSGAAVRNDLGIGRDDF